VGPAVPPCLADPSRDLPPQRLSPEPPAVTGGPVRVYWARRVARDQPFGRRLGEDLRQGSPSVSHRHRLAVALGTWLLVPVVALSGHCSGRSHAHRDVVARIAGPGPGSPSARPMLRLEEARCALAEACWASPRAPWCWRQVQAEGVPDSGAGGSGNSPAPGYVTCRLPLPSRILVAGARSPPVLASRRLRPWPPEPRSPRRRSRS
jgi:hypothetical protein